MIPSAEAFPIVNPKSIFQFILRRMKKKTKQTLNLFIINFISIDLFSDIIRNIVR